MIRVLVCDDQPGVRHLLQQRLALAHDVTVAGVATTGAAALLRVREGGVDLLLMDLAMPVRDGLDALRQLKCEFPGVPVLMHSPRPDRQHAVRSLKFGGAGCVATGADAAQMLGAIRQVAAGRLVVAAPSGGAARAPRGSPRPSSRAVLPGEARPIPLWNP